MALCHRSAHKGSALKNNCRERCNFFSLKMQLFGYRGSTRIRWPESLYSAPIMIPSTHVTGFKRWAREGGEWEGGKGSKIKREAEGVRKG